MISDYQNRIPGAFLRLTFAALVDLELKKCGDCDYALAQVFEQRSAEGEVERNEAFWV